MGNKGYDNGDGLYLHRRERLCLQVHDVEASFTGAADLRDVKLAVVMLVRKKPPGSLQEFASVARLT